MSNFTGKMFACIVAKNALTLRVLFAWYAYDLINLFSGQLISDWDWCVLTFGSEIKY